MSTADSYTRIWVQPHDDEDVRYVVNTREDMEMNYSDLEADGIAQGTFEEYLETWDYYLIPTDLLDTWGDDAEMIADWIEGQA